MQNFAILWSYWFRQDESNVNWLNTQAGSFLDPASILGSLHNCGHFAKHFKIDSFCVLHNVLKINVVWSELYSQSPDGPPPTIYLLSLDLFLHAAAFVCTVCSCLHMSCRVKVIAVCSGQCLGSADFRFDSLSVINWARYDNREENMIRTTKQTKINSVLWFWAPAPVPRASVPQRSTQFIWTGRGSLWERHANANPSFFVNSWKGCRLAWMQILVISFRKQQKLIIYLLII